MALFIVIFLVAAGLRLWALDFGLPSWLHPDEFSFVFFPLNFFSGDLNPHFFTYPTFHYYLLGLVYGLCFCLQKLFGVGHSLEQFVALHYFWERTQLMWLARLTSALLGIGTVAWTVALGARVGGRRAGWVAGSLLAVCAVHVRQSHLAGVDAAMTFWFVGATWAAARLRERERLADYLVAGALVGLAAATKYPGGLAGAAVLAAHLLAGRRLLDRRLWLAGGAALGCFVLGSPYALLDFKSFQDHFLHQAAHLGAGHGPDLGRGWWYHVRFSLVQGLGWPALALALVGAFAAGRRRQKEALVVLAGFGVFYLVMGAGQTVFVRYVLPLMPLQAVLAAKALARLRDGRWLVLATVLALVQPCYHSLRAVALLGREDTRGQARRWIEAHVPQGAALGNFGGWAGDVRVRTFEGLWWEVSHFERVFGRAQLDRALPFLESLESFPPFYSYVIQRSNIAAAAGSLEEVERLEATWVILHRHPLGYSQIDSAFAARLEQRAEQVARFSAEGLWTAGARYDPLDAFYVPLSGFGNIERPGPDVEIWKMRDYPIPEDCPWRMRELFAQAYVRGTMEMLGKGRTEEAVSLGQRALELDENCRDAYFVLGAIFQQNGDLGQAEAFYQRQLRSPPLLTNAATYHNLGIIYEKEGEVEKAEQAFQEALRAAPWKYPVAQSLAEFYRRQQQYDKAIEIYLELLDRVPERALLYEGLGRIYEKIGKTAEAEAVYQKALEVDGTQERIYLRLARLYGEQGRYLQLKRICESLLEINAKHPEAHRLLAHVYRHMGQIEKAREHAQVFVRLAPEDADAAKLRGWLERAEKDSE